MAESSAVGDSDNGKPAKASKSSKQPKGSGGQRTSLPTFYRQIVAELRKVVWPTQEQLVTYFFVCMAFVLVMMALISGLDLGFGKLAFAVFGGHRN